MKKKPTMKMFEKIFVESFEDFSGVMLDICERYEQYDRAELMEELINNITMFAVHSQIRLGKSPATVLSHVAQMIEAAETKIKKDKMQ